jgi:hypothetical protein
VAVEAVVATEREALRQRSGLMVALVVVALVLMKGLMEPEQVERELLIKDMVVVLAALKHLARDSTLQN